MADDGVTPPALVDRRPHIRAALFWTTVLSVLLAPLVIVGPFIAGYVGGRKAKTAPAALVAALGPALIWVGIWWWLSLTGVPVGKEKILPPADMFAPTTGLAILGGAFAGSGGRLAHVVGCAAALIALSWFWRGTKPLYDLYKHVVERPAAESGATASTSQTCPDRLKKLYEATMIYSDSWDGQLPPAGDWATALQNPDQNVITDEKILHCPDVSAGGGPKYGYAMNRDLGGKRIKEIKDGAGTPLFFDSNDLALNANAPATAIPSPGRHAGKSNVVYADGHLGQK